MNKILFITTRYPFPITGGDKLRAFDILKFLSRKNQIDLICLGDKKQIKNNNLAFCKNVKVFHLHFLSKIINTIIFFFKLEPLQNGYYLSNDMKYYIINIQNKYDTIICHLLRSSQYMPEKFIGKKVLEVTDLLSSNYHQTIDQLSIFNPLKYIYFLEKILVARYEKNVFKKFQNIVFVSKSDAKKAKKISAFKNKIFTVGNTNAFNKNLFKYKKNNKKIIFIGNIKYLPNKLACKDFAKNVLKKINLKYPEIQFHIIGDIGVIDKLILKSYKNVIVHGKIKNLGNVVKNSICGICNVKISTGFQNKILSYMSYGIPCIVSINSFKNTEFNKNREVLVFKNNEDLINKIFFLKENKFKAKQLSINSINSIKKKYNIKKTLSKYNKIV
jgi:glycosyltransferase involved in cell wall biosynthesis